MIAILFLFVVAMIPVAGVWLCIQAFRWLMKHNTGAEVQITPDNYFNMYRNMKTVWHHDPLNYEADSQHKTRKSKHTPHYDRLIEQDKQRLAEAQYRMADVVDEQEHMQLVSLLESKNENI